MTPAHTEGGLTVMIDTSDGKAAITGFCVIDENFNPPTQIKATEMEDCMVNLLIFQRLIPVLSLRAIATSFIRLWRDHTV